ncbi:MAG: HEAT repeat domain-containing protein [Phycisphaerae bacterium]|nr:HEAT repeat domain-containing protein [Phycisphaerae bacterium]
MEFLENVLSQGMVQRLGWMLVHFVWQASVVALFLGILLKLLRKSSASLRYVVSCLALVMVVSLPVITLSLISVVEPDLAIEISPAADPETELVAITPAPIEIEQSVNLVIPAIEAGTPVSRISASPVIPLRQRITEILEPCLPYAVMLWLVGVLGLSVWYLGGWTQLHRLRQKLVKPVDETLRGKFREVAGVLGVKRAVELMESALIQVPTVVGWLKPVILLPASVITGFSADQLEAILAHELAHIKRCDYLVNMLQTGVEILGFYHPGVWWVSKKIRIERENCCDDIAVKVSGDSIGYAKTLALFEGIKTGQSEMAVAASGGSLFERICRLIQKDSTSIKADWKPSVVVALFVIALLIPIGCALTAGSDEKSDVKVEGIERWGQAVRGLKCSVEMNARKYRVGDPVTIKVNLKNITNEAVNFYYQDLYAAESLIVENQKGEVVNISRTAVQYDWPLGKEFVRLIEPGKTFTHQIKGRVKYKFLTAEQLREGVSRTLLIDFHDVVCHITEKGEFSARLRLDLGEVAVNRSKMGGVDDIWTGTLESNKATFNVETMPRKELDKAIDALRIGNDDEVAEAIEILGANAGKKAVRQLMEILKGGSNLHMRKAGKALIQIQDTSIVPELIEMYEKPAPNDKTAREFKYVVMNAIGNLQSKQKANERFMEILKSDAPFNEIYYAAEQLALAEYKPALPVMIGLLKTDDSRKRGAVMSALEIFGHRLQGQNRKLVFEKLLEMMKNDPDKGIRKRAVKASAMVGGDSASPHLIEALKGPDPQVALSAMIYLGTYGSAEAIAPLQEYAGKLKNEKSKKRVLESIKFIRQRTGGVKFAGNKISWGEVVDRLQLGLGYDIPKSSYRQGERIRFNVFVRNNSNKVINLVHHGLLGHWPMILNSHGNAMQVNQLPFDRPVQVYYLSLSPGEIKEVGTQYLQLDADPQEKPGRADPNPYCYLTPGKYKIEQSFSFREDAKANFHGQLTTGKLAIEILPKAQKTAEQIKKEKRDKRVKELFGMYVRGEPMLEEESTTLFLDDNIPKLSWSDIPVLLQLAESDRALEGMPKLGISSYIGGEGREGMVALWLIDALIKKQVAAMMELQGGNGRLTNHGLGLNPICLKGNMSVKECENSHEIYREVLKLYQRWWQMACYKAPGEAAIFDPLELTDIQWVGRQQWERHLDIEIFKKVTDAGIAGQRIVHELQYHKESNKYRPGKKVRTIYYALKDPVFRKSPFTKEMLEVQKIVLHFYDDKGVNVKNRVVFPSGKASEDEIKSSVTFNSRSEEKAVKETGVNIYLLEDDSISIL